jgi:hypothetical protein
MQQLGASLTSDDLQCLVELIKNAYDADAVLAKIIIDAPDRIVIEDDGHGMDEETIKRGWLTISNSLKMVHSAPSPERVNVRDEHRRALVHASRSGPHHPSMHLHLIACGIFMAANSLPAVSGDGLRLPVRTSLRYWREMPTPSASAAWDMRTAFRWARIRVAGVMQIVPARLISVPPKSPAPKSPRELWSAGRNPMPRRARAG